MGVTEELLVKIEQQDTEIARLREALEVALKTIDYAVGCIEGTIRDYKDELPKKLYEAREALAKEVRDEEILGESRLFK